MKLKGKIALITGGATGIGRATAELYCAEGATVIIVDFNEPEGRRAVKEIERAGGSASFYQADVRSEEDVSSVLKDVASVYGRLDVLICSAGILKGARKRIDALLEEDWNATIDTNLKGTFLTIKHSVTLLEKAGASVLLLISSGAGVRGGSSSYAYAASKGGMYALHYNLESQLNPLGVRVHVVCPGSISTPLKLENIADIARVEGKDPEEAVAEARQELGHPLGVARVLTFLASRDADYVRGTIFTR